MKYSMQPIMKHTIQPVRNFLQIKLNHGEVLQKGWQKQIPDNFLDKCDQLLIIGGKLGDECLAGCPFRTIRVNFAESFGDGVFRDCSALETVGFSNCFDVNTMGKRAFENCHNLRLILLPPNLRIIEADTFTNCESLACEKSVNSYSRKHGNHGGLYLPGTLQAVDADAFKGCSSLKYIQVALWDFDFYSGDKLHNEKILEHLKQLGNSGPFLPEGTSLEYRFEFKQGRYQLVDFGDYVRGIKSIDEILEEASKAYEKSEDKAMSQSNDGMSSDELSQVSSDYELPPASSEHSAMSRFNAGMSSDELSQVSSESACNRFITLIPFRSDDDSDFGE